MKESFQARSQFLLEEYEALLHQYDLRINLPDWLVLISGLTPRMIKIAIELAKMWKSPDGIHPEITRMQRERYEKRVCQPPKPRTSTFTDIIKQNQLQKEKALQKEPQKEFSI